jgi:hypothetical protein
MVLLNFFINSLHGMKKITNFRPSKNSPESKPTIQDCCDLINAMSAQLHTDVSVVKQLPRTTDF